MIVLNTKQTGLLHPIVPLSRPDREGEFAPILAVGLTLGVYEKEKSILVRISGKPEYVKRNGKPSLIMPTMSFQSALEKFVDKNRDTLVAFFNREIDAPTLLSNIEPIK
jgi:hypothetical protein